MRPYNFDIQEVINNLQGTCQTLEEALPEGMHEYDLSKADWEEIDWQIFRCEQCGWWCEICEQSEHDEAYCEECYND